MTASISLPILPQDGTLTALGSFENTELKQVPASGVGSFGSLLGAALSDTAEAGGVGDEVNGPAAALLTPLQSLPQGGKLLPLLQSLNGAEGAAAGPAPVETDLPALELTAGLDALPDETAGALLQQLGVARGPLQGAPKIENLSSKSVVYDVLRQAGVKLPPEPGRVPADPQPADSDVPLAEKLTGTMPLPSAPPGQVQTELVAALQTIRRLAGGRPAATVDPAGTRPESVAVGGAGNPGGVTVPAVAPAAAPTTLTLGVPLQQPNWDQALGERIQWLVSQGGQVGQGAQIKLNPAHLGPMEVRIQMQDDQANIQFTATHAVVRDALEAALPRLRDMLGASGVELVNVDISGESFAEQQRTAEDGGAEHRSGSGSGPAESGETVIESALISTTETGVLDLFA